VFYVNFFQNLVVYKSNIERGVRATVKGNFKEIFMLIGELVKRSGLTKDAIRFYEKRGLINLDKKQRRENNYKEYPEQVLDRLMLIKTIKGFGFTLSEIDTFFELWKAEDASCENLAFTLEEKVNQIDDQMKRLTELRSKLTSSLEKCRNDNCEFEKSVPSCVRC
jgi:DNA-binding transcriptional MerR regulator